MSPLRQLVRDLVPAAVEIRHDLHAHPELGYKEIRTSEVVQGHLKKCGVEFKAGLAGGTGVLGWLPATSNPESARTVALRADMDALPILENTGVEYQSTCPGVMHACGHDGHTTILMTTAQALSLQKERPNNVLLIFQPAEEGGAGGDRLCKEGVLRGEVIGKPADVIFGLHGFPSIEVGKVSTRVGPLLASATEFNIVIRGKGAHAAQPHRGIDPIVIGARVITGLQTVASRTVDPLDAVVVTVGQILAGVAHNVIPDTARLRGTLRALNEETNELAKGQVERIAMGVASAFGASAVVEWVGAYPVTINEPGATDEFRRIAAKTIGGEMVLEEKHPTMGGEDFSFYGRQVPASFFFLGIRPDGASSYPNLHSPEFDFNDDALPIGIELMCELALGK